MSSQSQSQGSISTALAANSGGQPVPSNISSGGGGVAMGNNRNSNKMRLEMPPRPAKIATATNRRGSASAAAAAAAAGGGGQNKGDADASVPHVVRVTFLGVAGLLAKPLAAAGDGSSSSSSGPITAEASTPSASATAGPASAEHRSLLLPLPPNMRIVASVSRSRTARGIPSGMSKRLTSPNPNNNNSGGGNNGNLQNNNKSASPGSIGSEKRKRNNNNSSNSNNNPPVGIDEISINRDHSMMSNSLAEEKTGKGHRRKGSHSSHRSNSSNFNMAPPSQLAHSRTGSRLARSGSKLSSGNNSGSREAAGAAPDDGGGNRKGPDEGIEVIRPYSPTEDSSRSHREKGKTGKPLGRKTTGKAAVDTDADEPERLVAVWDEKLPTKASQPFKAATQGNAAGDNARGKQQAQFVNLTNSLAFEAELRPSSASAATTADTDEGRASTPVASTTFAPKSFCVTVGLVPDFDMAGEGRSGSQILDDLGESSAAEGGNNYNNNTTSSAATPTFAIPVGFADLVINGDETLDGKRKQIDLPLSSLASFIDMFGGAEKVAQRGQYPFPLIELTAEGLAGAVTASSGGGTAKSKEDEAGIAATTDGKRKKKSIVKRMFSRKHQQARSAAAGKNNAAASPQGVHSGDPRSIYGLGRPPNAAERALFLKRYGIDPSGDAVVRIGLEVFPRGSELEKVFRQKNKLRKKAALEAARAAASGGRRRPHGVSSRDRSKGNNGGGRYSPSHSLGSRGTYDTGDSRSLMDDEDEGYLDSDYEDSVFSQSFFTLDSDASRTTWDESTMYTDALSSFNTMRDDDDDDSLSYTTGFTGEFEGSDRRRRSPKRGGGNTTVTGLFAGILGCGGGPGSLQCGASDDDDDETTAMATSAAPYSNIDQVASAIASMSMVESHGEGQYARLGSRGSLKSPSSMDTTARGNNNNLGGGGSGKHDTNHRAVSPHSIAEGGEELTLDVNPEAARSSGEGGRRVGPLSPLDTDIPMEQRQMTQATSQTVEEESTPMAMIKTRFAESKDFDAIERKKQQEEQGTEFTLEEHQSSM